MSPSKKDSMSAEEAARYIFEYAKDLCRWRMLEAGDAKWVCWWLNCCGGCGCVIVKSPWICKGPIIRLSKHKYKKIHSLAKSMPTSVKASGVMKMY